MRLTVWLSGLAWARAMIWGSVGLGPGRRGAAALQGPLVDLGQHEVGAVDLVAGSAEVLADPADVVAAGAAVCQQPGSLRLVRVVPRAGVDAQLGLQLRADRAGVDEADQAAGEVGVLGPGGQPDGQPPGGDVVDEAVPGVGDGGAVADEPLVQGQLW